MKQDILGRIQSVDTTSSKPNIVQEEDQALHKSDVCLFKT